MIARLRARQEWALAGALRRADARLTTAWWAGILLRGTLPAVLAVASGWLIAAITDGTSTAGPLLTFGAVFVISQLIGPLHEAVGYNLGDRTSTSLNDRLMAVTLAPPGIAHLERADLSADLTMARDFDLGITGPPLSFAMNFLADGLTNLVVGVASAVGAGPLRMVAGHRARPRLVGDPLAAARERRVAGPQHPGGARRPAPCRLRLPLGRRPAGGQGGPPLRAGRLGDRSLRQPPPTPPRSAAPRDAAARTVRRPLPPDRDRRQRLGVLVVRRPSRRRPPRTGGGRRGAAGGHRRQRDRLRRAELGRRWRRRAGRRRPAAGGHDAARRPARRPPGRRVCATAVDGRCAGAQTRWWRAGAALRRRLVQLPGRTARAGAPRPRRAGGLVTGDRRAERRREDDAGQAALPALRPGRRRDPRRRH